jgi:excisionase family DNA binding protein
MTTATIDATAVVMPEGTTQHQAAAIGAFLHFAQSRSERDRGSAKLVSADGHEVDVPEQLFGLLRQVAEIMARGDGVVVNAISRELTTTEAAHLLGMSRPTLIRLLDTGQIPAHRVGTHRRVQLLDVIEYRRERLRQQRKAYEELMLESDALGIEE